MVQRTPPQSKTDDSAFPVRVRLLLPPGNRMLHKEILDWLDDHLDRGDYAYHSGRVPGRVADAIAFYFRTVEAARALLSAFPDLVLADGTDMPGYTSPVLRTPRTHDEWSPVCDLYAMTRSQEELRSLLPGLHDRVGNLPPLPSISPESRAPIVRTSCDGWELVMGRWSMPPPPLIRAERLSERGVANIRNTSSQHWEQWLAPEHRCLIPFTSFAHRGLRGYMDFDVHWFALDESRPLAFMAGLWTRWAELGPNDVPGEPEDGFGIVTCRPNITTLQATSKGMPVLLTTAEQRDIWMTAPAAAALRLQQPLPEGVLRLVARGEDMDWARSGVP